MGEWRCFDCGKTLQWTGSGPGWMNRDQWDAVKAGDYFAPCEKANHENGNCYFWERGDGYTLKRNTPQPPEAT